MTENEVKNQEQEQGAFEYDDGLYGKKIEPTPVPEKNIGVDQHDILVNTFADEGTSSQIDVAAIEKFTNVSQNRNEVYTLLDSMAEDPTIASALEIYATEATEYNDEGKIVWCESSDEDVSKYVTFLLDSMNVDKNIYKWAYSLCKYGDLYLRLYRDSDYQDPIFDKDGGDEKDKKKSLTEKLNEIKEEEFNKKNGEKLDESVKVVVHSKNDKYVHYIDMVSDPATMFELTKFGKTYGYIKAPNNMIVKRDYGEATNDLFRYSFKQKDVEVYQPDDYVHACIEDNSSRQDETVVLSLGDKEDESESSKYTYTVRRGRSILMTAFKIWREMMLLENSILLNRVTKSSIFRIFGIEIGDMPKEQVGPYLDRFKNMVEQRLAFNVGKSMSEYNNPGPIENIIYVPTRNGQGSVSTQQVGGDVDVKGLADLDYFRQKLSGGLRIPQQYLGWTDGATGFNGGTSLSIVSARFAKEVKRVQNTLVQALTDAVNLMLWDKGLTNYINNFEIHMLPPTTQEDIDRRDNLSSRVGIIRDIINLTDAVEDTSKKLKILKSLLADVVTDSDVITVIQEKIDELEAEGEEGASTDGEGGGDMLSPEGGSPSETDTTDLGSLFGDTDEPETFTPEGGEGEEGAETEAPEETVGELPSPDSLGIDFTRNQDF